MTETLIWHYGLMARDAGPNSSPATPQLAFFRDAIGRFRPARPWTRRAAQGRLLLPGARRRGYRWLRHVGRHARPGPTQGGRGGPRVAVFRAADARLPAAARLPDDLPLRFLRHGRQPRGGSGDFALPAMRIWAWWGALVVNIQAPYASASYRGLWSRKGRRALPQPWPEEPLRRNRLGRQPTHRRFRILDVDPLTQIHPRGCGWKNGRKASGWPRRRTPCGARSTSATNCASCCRSPASARSSCRATTPISRRRPTTRSWYLRRCARKRARRHRA